MKIQNLILLGAWILISLFSCQTSKKSQQIFSSKNLESEYKFTPLVTRYKDSTDTLSAFLIVQLSQNMYQKGLRLLLRFDNESSNKINILNPLDFFHLSLFNESKFNVLPSNPSRYLINMNQPFAYSSFVVDSVSVNERVNNLDMNTVKAIDIPSHGTYKIYLSIKSILKTDESHKPIETGELSQVLKGKYYLLASLGIVRNKTVKDLGLNPIPIDYN